ncbi:putative SET domain protein [Trypanosoma grayi]|uniref:putative SET domain protein n=1 Tax=Trypanosoma grayi TaxID=71804 RepID=UPI0004F494CE|nr:putative SET domain protein [Trypanosoma grayi]KEG12196.1 putative SET domain protein [Trypanosoma grayi]
MGEGDTVAVFCDEQYEREWTSRLKSQAQFPYKIIPVRNGPSMYRAVREFCASQNVYRCALNLCTGTTEDEHCASSVLLASLFDHNGVVYGGCRYAVLKQPLELLFMMCFYAGLPMPRFSVVKSYTDIERLELQFPVKFRSANTLQGTFECTVEEASALPQALKEALANYGKVVVWEVNAAKGKQLQVLVSGTSYVTIKQNGVCDNVWLQRCVPVIEGYVTGFAKNVINKTGFAKMVFNQSPHSEDLILEDIVLNCSLIEPGSDALSADAAKCFFDERIREGERDCRPPTIEVRHTGDNKGYYLCAARNTKKGEIVFEDEGNSFAIVTKPFVEKQWGPEEKALFAEYAWPLDADGHVYAIWESDPNRWRPINHSCDPNCIFDEGHSLNVAAARDINEGEELTMDYSTFCDYTMKPFQCFCGSASCRGLIVPDEASLRKYGTNTWHRRPPVPPTKGI